MKANTTTDTLLDAVAASDTYRDYERSFAEATGLPITLRTTESWKLVHHKRKNENPFCALMAEKSRACAACLQVQQRLSENASKEPACLTCPHGLCDAAVPVRVGTQTLGLLQTGQVFNRRPTEAQYQRTVKLAQDWGIEVDADELRRTYFATRVLSTKQLEAVMHLLSIFAQHLSMLTNQMVVQRQNAEPPVVTRAKEYIEQNHREDISLGDVAKAVHSSTFYFCKVFKKATGIGFTDYLSRIRVEKAKNLLLNPNLRISEIAYEVGFQSLTHFNRVFKRVVGQSPTAYREQLPKTEKAC